MEKIKLIEARKKKGYSQMYMADQLHINEANYCRREKGLSKISAQEWEKISQILNVPTEEIFEHDDNHIFICNDNASGNYQGTNNIYAVPEYLLEVQKKYIQKLELEIQYWKDLFKNKESHK